MEDCRHARQTSGGFAIAPNFLAARTALNPRFIVRILGAKLGRRSYARHMAWRDPATDRRKRIADRDVLGQREKADASYHEGQLAEVGPAQRGSWGPTVPADALSPATTRETLLEIRNQGKLGTALS
jgi:hypothetical protein